MPGHFPDNPEKILERSLATKVAILLVGGHNVHRIATEIGVSDAKVKNLMKTDECIRVMRELTAHEKDFAKAKAAKHAGDLIDECFRVIKEKLKKNDLKAVSLTLKASGVFDEVEQTKNDSSIVVVMPGAQAPAIDVTPKDE